MIFLFKSLPHHFLFLYLKVGDGTQVRAVAGFQLIRGLEGHHMVAVACGWAHSIALSRSGQVWVWGSNSHGQLGLPKDEVTHLLTVYHNIIDESDVGEYIVFVFEKLSCA